MKSIAKLLAWVTTSVVLSSTPAWAAYPDKPVRLIVPFAAGGGTDTWARMYAQRLGTQLGQTVIVENRPGANTQIGANAVAKAAADGYTLLFTSGTHVQVPLQSLNVPYDVQRDFAPVAHVGTVGLVFAVNASVPANNMREFIAQAKTQTSWGLGTYAAGSTGAVFSQYMTKTENLQMPVVVYKGEAPAIADVAGGQIQGGFFSVPSAKALIQGGRLKALGMLAGGRSPALPEVSTLVEQGMTRYKWPGIWLGVFAPAQTPAPVLEKLAEASRVMSQDESFRKEMADRDLAVSWKSPADFRKDIGEEMKIWGELLQSLGIKPE